MSLTSSINRRKKACQSTYYLQHAVTVVFTCQERLLTSMYAFQEIGT